jgi:hypothetical protein
LNIIVNISDHHLRRPPPPLLDTATTDRAMTINNQDDDHEVVFVDHDGTTGGTPPLNCADNTKHDKVDRSPDHRLRVHINNLAIKE